MNDTPQWIREHGAEYAVPTEVLALVTAGLASDESWHNDTCPSFRHATSNRRIFIDHPQKEMREMRDNFRFSVTQLDEDGADVSTIYHGDDLTDALCEFRGITNNDRAALRALAGIALFEEWGNEKQVAAENAFAEIAKLFLTPAQVEEWDRFALKATTEENLAYGFTLLGLKVTA